jgi:1,2-diacylglycerol 3-alpha-glucosyltransferase
MRIAILVPNFVEYDGGAQVARLQAEELAKEGNEVAIFTFRAGMRAEGAKVFVMGMPRSLFWERLYRLLFPLDILKTLRWLPRLKGYDELIVHLYPLTWLACLARLFYRVRYTFWYHGIMDPSLFPHLYERVYMRLQILLTRLTVRNADRAVAVSRFAQAELKRYTGLNSEVFVYNRVDPRRFHPGVDGTRIRQELHLGDAPVILSVGGIRPVKGFHYLLQAFKLVKREVPDARLVIVGRHDYPYYSKQLREMADDSVIFTGPIPNEELPPYYAMCDLYATCSQWETFNIPIAEAQACGKPVVAFHIGPHPEVIDEKGVLVEPRNVVEFARACIEKLRQARRGG